jgi:hypothetical protein
LSISPRYVRTLSCAGRPAQLTIHMPRIVPVLP